MRTVCFYAYYEKNEKYKSNFKFFLEHGINAIADYVIIVNGSSTVQIPQLSNVTVLQRDNEGYDFGAWTEGLNLINVNNYDYFIFLNTSVKGPYVKNPNEKPWQRYFTDMITDDVKLVGTTINISTLSFPLLEKMGFVGPFAHVQSQVFAMDKPCLFFLKDIVFVPHNDKHTFEDIITLKEVGMSQYVLRNGWNINCLLPLYSNKDYRKIKSDINYSSLNGDPSFKGKYFGRTYSPFDVIFIKTNRDLFEGFSKYKPHFTFTNLIIPVTLALIAAYRILHY